MLALNAQGTGYGAIDIVYCFAIYLVVAVDAHVAASTGASNLSRLEQVGSRTCQTLLELVRV